MKQVLFIFALCLVSLMCSRETRAQPLPCQVLTDESGNQKANGSQLCVKLKFTNGRLDFDRTGSKFLSSDEFRRRLSIPLAEAEEILYTDLRKLFNTLTKPYRFGLSDAEKQLEDEGKLNPTLIAAVRETSGEWLTFRGLFDVWADAGQDRRHFDEIFQGEEAARPGSGIIAPLTNAQVTTASLIYEEGYAPDEGAIRFFVADPINNWSDLTQVQISLPGVADAGKRDTRLKRIKEILQPLTGRPRCLDCMTARISAFYRRLGLTPNLIFDNKGTSPLILTVIEGARIVGISWLSVDDDKDIEKVLYSLLTYDAFKQFYEHRSAIKTEKRFDYVQRTGKPGPYLNETRLQIQQLLVNQLGYTVSFAFAANKENPLVSNYNLTIQKASEIEKAEDEDTSGETQNQTPESAPATANPEGVVTGHEQEKEAETEFEPNPEPSPKIEEGGKKEKTRDKKRYLGGGLDYRPGQGVRFFGLGQISRFPFLPDSVNSLSAKGGGHGTDGGLGSVNYFGDYLFFNTLRRRVSVQLTIGSDFEADRNLSDPLTDERRRTGVGRLELEMFRDWSGSLLRFFAEGRRGTVALQPPFQPVTKTNLTTLEIGALYLFESQEVENPRRIRLEPRFKSGLGLAVDEPRFNKSLTTGNFHQALPGGYEMDVSGRIEFVSKATPLFELPSFGGADVIRGFRRDDGLGRKLWSLQNELWIPLPLGDETNTGLKAMLREKMKLAPFVDVGGLYDAVNISSGIRSAVGLGLRFIYNPIIFKIDYARGFGSAATAGSRGKFHFSVGSNLPF